MDRGVILTHGFRVQLAKNGGVMVFQHDLYMEPEAVFTDTASFLSWLADQIEGLKTPPEPRFFSDLVLNVCNCTEGMGCTVCSEFGPDGLTFKKKDSSNA